MAGPEELAWLQMGIYKSCHALVTALVPVSFAWEAHGPAPAISAAGKAVELLRTVSAMGRAVGRAMERSEVARP